MRNWLIALKDCEPPETCITASVLPCVGRTEPADSGIQSNPDLTLRPGGQLSQLIHLWVVDRRSIGKRQAFRIEDPDLAAEVLEQPRGFVREEATIGYRAK